MAYQNSTLSLEQMLLKFMSEQVPMLSMLQWLCEQMMEAEVTAKIQAQNASTGLFFHAFCPSFHFSKQRFSCQLIQIGHHSGEHGACPFFHPAAAIFQPFGKHAHRSFRASHRTHSGGVNPSVFQPFSVISQCFGTLFRLAD